MKFFLAGSKGMLASDLLPLLKTRGEVITGDLPDFDITDLDSSRRTLHEARPDVVINCAAYTAVDKAEEEKERAYAVNGRGAGNLALICRDIRSKLIHISTDFVFDGKNNRPYVEDAGVNPLSVYGSSKLAGEALVSESSDENLTIRTSWLFGLHGNNFVKTIMRLAGEREELGIVFDQTGTPTYTKDLAEAILNLIDSEARGIYHFSNEGVCSWYDFAYAVIENMRRKGHPIKLKRLNPIRTEDYPLPAERPAYSVLDKGKYKKLTSKNIPHWSEGLKQYFNEK